MSAKKFKFVSPGVFLSEIDNSQLPKEPGGIGPVIIGRTRRGPAMKPVKVSSFQEFVEVFGEPIPGAEGEDPWRDGNGLLASSYAPYAAQAYLKAKINSPVTVIRLLGVEGDDASDAGAPGWSATNAYGVFMAPSASVGTEQHITASLVSVVYSTDANFELGISGLRADGRHGHAQTSSYASATSTVTPVQVANNLQFTLSLKHTTAGTLEKTVSFREGASYIRDVLNTNPVLTNANISAPPTGTLASHYWLGETFEEEYEALRRNASVVAGDSSLIAFVALLESGAKDFKSSAHGLSEAKTGWVIPQYAGAATAYKPQELEKLFRICTLQEGEQGMDFTVSIEGIKIADEGNPSPYGRFDVVVRQRRGSKIYVVDSFENLNLNPNSDNFVARRIGDQYFKWDGTQKRNKLYGGNPNMSSHIRVEMNLDVGENGPSNPRSVPFGFLGPVIPGAVNNSPSAHNPAGVGSATDPHGELANFSSKWINSDLLLPDSTKTLKVKWPSVPVVTTGSQGVDLVSKYILGATPYRKQVGTEYENYSSANRGLRDHLRKFGEGTTAVSAQLTGIATANTEHSFIFSLDDVVIKGSEDLSSDLSSFTPTSVDFTSGSHVGTIAAAATAIDCIDTTGYCNSAADASFTISISAAAGGLGGTAVTIFLDENQNGGQNTNGANKISIGTFDGAETDALAAAYIIDAINGVPTATNARIVYASSGNGEAADDLGITAKQGSSNTKITLTMDATGTAGNITSALALTAGFDIIDVTAFTGGVTGVSGTAYTVTYPAASLLSVVSAFTMTMVGGCDGVNITEADPFNMRASTAANPTAGTDSTTRNSYAHASVDRAIELIKDPESLEMNMATAPGITNTALTTKLVQTCEARADALAIIDLPDIYIPPYEAKCASFEDRVNNTNPERSAKNLTARQLNSSYGAAYYPWVKIRDQINGRDVWSPPSVVALGVMAYTEQRDDVWFAPAGFNRGGLNEGNAGVPVLQVSEQLLSSQRDKLYEANINPIASFVSEGLVVFGQKTLQLTPSALDRINVRRLLIFVKKEISRIANGLLFDQNVTSTWNRFKGQVIPFLESVKTRLGLTDFKVILDETTTTPDLVDRNVMYAKIFLKPARAIEFIAVDFVITRSGASFDD